MPQIKTILFAPLNWGLGHATRIVPLIKKELVSGNKVILGANGAAFDFLKHEFPDLTLEKIVGFNVRYWPKPFFNFGLFLQLPLFYFSFLCEKQSTKQLLKKHNINYIVSDNRYGVRSKKVHSVFITHQLFIKTPKALKIFEPIVHLITKNLIKKFNECWVPDYEDYDKSLSKELSHNKTTLPKIKYIGPLSRFTNLNLNQDFKPSLNPDILVLISGPEPQRTKFQQQMTERFLGKDKKVLMVCGKPKAEFKKQDKNIYRINHLPTKELTYYLKHTPKIIARSGYSTLMDLHVLGVKAELIPTPGQPEQMYLAEINNC